MRHGPIFFRILSPSARMALAALPLMEIVLFSLALSGCGPREEAGVPSGLDRNLLLDPSHPEWTREAPQVWRALFETSKGDFVVEVERELAPIGVDRFYNLIRLGYYDDTRFHRVREGYIVQFGLHGDPEVNAAWLINNWRTTLPGGATFEGLWLSLDHLTRKQETRRSTSTWVTTLETTLNPSPFSVGWWKAWKCSINSTQGTERNPGAESGRVGRGPLWRVETSIWIGSSPFWTG